MNRLTRREAVKTLGGISFGVAASQACQEPAWAHDLKPGDPLYRYAEYEAIVNRSELRVRQVYEWPNINNATIYSNIRNGLNGFQFSYDIPTELIQIVVQAYGGANPAMYDDFIWGKYRFGESTGIKDPQTGRRRPETCGTRAPCLGKTWQAVVCPPTATTPFTTMSA